MSGLLLKDFYMTIRYCRTYLFIAIAFIALSFASSNSVFFIFYPCLLCGMIPVNLLGYDERSRWSEYSATLPYSHAQLISSKYLIGLLAQFAMLVATGITQTLRGNRTALYQGYGLLPMLLMLFIASTITPAISLPFLFKLGAEKGRIAYLVMVAIMCAAIFVGTELIGDQFMRALHFQTLLPLLCIAEVLIYALSWLLSIHFYKNREL